MNYKIFKFKKKKKGEFRTIYAPSQEYKNRLILLNGQITQKVERENEGTDHLHGFLPKHSPVTNARKHIGFKWTACFDLADFFDSVDESKVPQLNKEEKESGVFIDGFARQGLNTSPSIANLAGLAIDKALFKWRDKKKLDFVYTRYADDLTFSFNDKDFFESLKIQLKQIVGRCGFKLNESKTRLQDSRFGNREVTGIMVGDSGISVGRKFKRRMRAAKHQQNEDSLQGMEEWAKLKMPVKKTKKTKSDLKEIQSFLKPFNLQCPEYIPERNEKDIHIGKNMMITSDPYYILGASSFGTNWSSCYGLKSGSQRTTVLNFIQVRGVRIAVYLSNDTKTLNGITRYKIKARAWVYETRDGQFGFGRVYGESKTANEYLRDNLKNYGIPSIITKHGKKIKGYFKRMGGCYLDNCVTVDAVAKRGGPYSGQTVKILKVK